MLKDTPANAGDQGSIPASGRAAGVGKAAHSSVLAKSRAQLSDWPQTHTHTFLKSKYSQLTILWLFQVTEKKKGLNHVYIPLRHILRRHARGLHVTKQRTQCQASINESYGTGYWAKEECYFEVPQILARRQEAWLKSVSLIRCPVLGGRGGGLVFRCTGGVSFD